MPPRPGHQSDDHPLRRRDHGSALMGMAGAFLTLSAFNSFFPTMVQGAAGSASRSSFSPPGGQAGRCSALCCLPSSTASSSGSRLH